MNTPGVYLPMVTAGTSVITGVSLKNTGEQLFQQDMKTLGMTLFVGGWVIAAYAFFIKFQGKTPMIWGMKPPAYMIILPIIGIVYAAMTMNKIMSENKEKKKLELEGHEEMEMPMYLPILFIISWLVFVSAIAFSGMPKPIWAQILPILAAFFVFYSMMFLLPKEREAKVADGLGMVIFFIAWLMIGMAMTR